MAITADRGGLTAMRWYETGIPVRVDEWEQRVVLRLYLDSKGGGTTRIRINIEPSSYEEIISAMLACDYGQTMRAFSKAAIARNRARS
jgi:hypothetical protein